MRASKRLWNELILKKVIVLLKALREHDTEIAQIIDEILINEGRGKGFSLRNRKTPKLD